MKLIGIVMNEDKSLWNKLYSVFCSSGGVLQILKTWPWFAQFHFTPLTTLSQRLSWIQTVFSLYCCTCYFILLLHCNLERNIWLFDDAVQPTSVQLVYWLLVNSLHFLSDVRISQPPLLLFYDFFKNQSLLSSLKCNTKSLKCLFSVNPLTHNENGAFDGWALAHTML